MPTPHVTPPGSGTASTWQIGTYNAVTDAWTLVLDLNDRSTWFIKSYDLAQPEKKISRSGNPRTQGERITNERYGNRYISLTLQLRSTTTLAAIDSAIHTLEAALSNTPFMLRFAEAQAAQYSYAIVKSWQHAIPQDPLQRLAYVKTGITLVLECEPFFLGDKLYLDNLVVNPGFEAPSGPGVQVFADTFATTNAYALQAGGAATLSPSNTFVDVVMANGGANLLRYYRLGETSGTVAYDIGGMNNPGTYTGSPTLGVAGGVSGDTDTAVTFASASSQYVDCPTTGLPTGNGAISFLVRFKFAANPAANSWLMAYGAATSGAHNVVGMYIDTTGKLNFTCNTTPLVTTAAAVTTGAYHTAALTWDGTTLTGYLDGASAGTAAPGANTIPTTGLKFRLGATADTSAAFFWNGQLDEAMVWNVALGSTAISNIHAAANAGATGTVASAMSLPAAARVAFGSPAWGALNMWQVRFRWVSGLTGSFYLHYTDASNHLRVDVASSASGYKLVQTIAGVANSLGSATVGLTHEAWYWLQVTQFPITSGNQPMVQATLYNDSGGAIGTAVTNGAIGPVQTFDGVTALSGRPQIACSGANLAIGGAFANVHTVSLFGPGGWPMIQNFSAGLVSGGWEQNTANTYPNGPVTSYGALRMDYPPAGTASATWAPYTGGAPGGTFAIPVAAAGNALGVSGWVKSSGLHASNGSSSLVVSEYNSSGTFLRNGSVQTVLGSATNAAWTQVSGTYTTGASCAYVAVACETHDTAIAGESANATVWFDNVQCWDQTANGGQTTMGYCELRFPQSPAQLVVSGLVGDVSAPAYIVSGSFASSFAAGSTLSLLLGRRAQSHAQAQLIGYPSTYSGLTVANILDSTAYGGYYWRSASGSTSDQSPLPAGPTYANTLRGVYAFIHRARTSQTAGNLANLSVYANAIAFTTNNTASVPSQIIGNPFSASNTWTLIKPSPVFFPPFGMLASADLSQVAAYVVAEWADSTGGGSQWSYDTSALLPIDSETLAASFIRPTTMSSLVNTWIFLYADGLTKLFGAPNALFGTDAAWGWSTNFRSATPIPAQAIGGAGTTSSANPSINPTGHAYLQLDPHAGDSTGATGVNQFLASAADQNGNLYGVSCSLAYVPLYLDPR